MPGRDDRGGGRAADRLALVVDEEHAVGVAVEREADVGAEVEHRALEVLQVLGLDRVGGVVRERAVELAEEHGQRRTAGLRTPSGTTSPPMPLAVSATTLSGRSADDVDERAHVLAERRRAGRRARPCPATSPRDVTPDATISLICVQAGLLADRRGAGAAQLDAVVLRGVVAGGEHRAGRVERARPRSRRRRSSTARCR